MHRIVIIGGGAGGLALATRLGDRLGRRQRAQITLIDAARTHIWKPLLHQLAAGSYDTHAEEIEYLAQARWHHFQFRLGALTAIDRAAKTIELAATYDETGAEITPVQRLAYDTLVIAIGSQTNDFGTPGAAEHTIKLDNPAAAKRFNERLINACIRAQSVPRQPGSGLLTVAIVGGGATGVELAAELHNATRTLASFGFDHIHPDEDLRIVLIEAGPRLLAQLPERLSEAAARELRKLSVEVLTNERVVEVSADQLKMASGKVIPATLAVWAAGVKANALLAGLGGADPLATNKINQLLVDEHLRTTRDASIFAFGDCAACPQPDGGWVPPRAQSAYQQAMYLAKALPALIGLAGAPRAVPPFLFKDRGSLVSLSYYSSVGSLMGSLTRGSLFVEGALAKLMYWALHKQHQLALGGLKKTLLITLSEWLDRSYRPRIKLH